MKQNEPKSDKEELLELRKRYQDLNARYLSIFDSMKDAMILINSNLEIIDINRSGLTLLGQSKDQILGKKCHNILHNSSEPCDICSKNVSSDATDEEHLKKFGDRYFSITSLELPEDAEGRAQSLDIIKDVTEQKKFQEQLITRNTDMAVQNEEYLTLNEEYASQNEELHTTLEELNKSNIKLAESQQRFKDLFENSLSGIFYVGTDGEILEANKAILNILNFNSRDELKKLNFFHSPFAKETGYDKDFKICLQTGKNVEGEKSFYNRLNQRVYIHFYLSPIFEDGNIIGVLSSNDDITERKTTQLQLKKSEEQMRAILDSSLHTFILLNLHREIVAYNATASKWFQEFLQQKLEKGKKLEEYMNQNDANAFIHNFLKVRKGEHLEVERIFKYKERELILNTYYSPSYNNNGEITGITINGVDVTQRVHAEKAMAASERLFRSVFEQATVGIGQILPDRKFGMINPSYCQILGYSEVELKQMSFLEITHPEDVVWEQQLLERIYKGEVDSLSIEKRYIHKSGNIVWVSGSSNIVRDENGNALYGLSIIVDITERKAMEMAQRESEKQFKALFFDNKSVMLLINPKSQRIVEANDAALQFYGYKKEEFVGKEFPSLNIDVLPVDYFERESIAASKYFSRHIAASGKIKHIELQSDFISYSGQSLIYCIIHDVTEETKAKIRLERAENVALTGNWEIYLKSGKMDSSAGARSIYGLQNKEYELSDIQIIPLEKYRPLLDKALKGLVMYNKPYDVEFEIKRPVDGEIRFINSIATYDKSEHKVFGIIQDITRRKEIESQLIEAKKLAEENNKLKSAFLSNMSHEIRTPMNGIIGFSKMLMNRELSEENHANFTKIIVDSSNQLLSIVNDILDISKIETGQVRLNPEETSLNDLIMDLFSFFEPKSMPGKLVLLPELSLSIEKATVNIDHQKLKQILTNLLSNALKFTSEGRIKFGYKLEGKKLLFYVSDTGIGIKPEHHEKIFDRFLQSDNSLTKATGGTGLGLAISRGYIELMGGKIWVESKPGEGATFYFTMPYMPVQNRKSAATDHEKKNTTKPLSIKPNQKVLVVEDEEVNFMYIKELLHILDIEIIHARTAGESLELYRKHSDLNLVLMDIKLPDFDGYEAMKSMRKINPDIPIIAQTAYAMEEEKDKILKSGFNDYIPKPIIKPKLIELLNEYLN